MKIRVSAKTFFILTVIVFSLGVFSTIAFAWLTEPTAADILADAGFQVDVQKEWTDSQTDDKDKRHEEGGWIVQCRTLDPITGTYSFSYQVQRVPSGGKDGITPGTPPDVGVDCRIIGFKHTHPNPSTDEDGTEWEQGPSEADKAWHEKHGIPGIIVNAGGTESFGPASGTYK